MLSIFSRMKSLETLYLGEKEISGSKWRKSDKWVRENVLQGDLAPKEEVLTHFAII